MLIHCTSVSEGLLDHVPECWHLVLFSFAVLPSCYVFCEIKLSTKKTVTECTTLVAHVRINSVVKHLFIGILSA